MKNVHNRCEKNVLKDCKKVQTNLINAIFNVKSAFEAGLSHWNFVYFLIMHIRYYECIKIKRSEGLAPACQDFFYVSHVLT